MNATCTHNVNNLRFTILGKKEDRYTIQIERNFPWSEMIVYGELFLWSNCWVLDNITLENGHSQAEFDTFFLELRAVCATAYPETVKYYEANHATVDVVSAINSFFDPFKKAI